MKKSLFLLSTFLIFTISCSEEKKTDTSKLAATSETINRKAEPGTILVLNHLQQPLAGAKVLIGQAQGQPFANNFLTTDQEGKIVIPEEWTDLQPVTVQANGYSRITYLAQTPEALTFKLNPILNPPRLSLTGSTTGHPVSDSDGFVDFGLVMSAMSRNDILAFDLSKVISTQFDQISVIGQPLDIPTNVTLPKQREFYGIFPINLNKPNYKLLFSSPGEKKVYAARARFPFRTVVDEIRAKKKFYELINRFEISGGVIRTVQIKNSNANLNLPVNETNFSAKRNLRAPAIRADEVIVALALADFAGEMIPTDIKKLESNKAQALAIHNSAPSLVATVLKRSTDFEGEQTDTLSASLVPFQQNLKPVHLPLIEKPRLSRSGDLLITVPRKTNEVSELATLAQLSEVQEIEVTPEIKIPFLVRRWEVYAPSWVDKMDLPTWPTGTPRGQKMRWEATYLGSQLKNESELGQDIINAATHFTHSSVDF